MPDGSYQMPGASCQMSDARCQMSDARCQMPDDICQIPVASRCHTKPVGIVTETASNNLPLISEAQHGDSRVLHNAAIPIDDVQCFVFCVYTFPNRVTLGVVHFFIIFVSVQNVLFFYTPSPLPKANVH